MIEKAHHLVRTGNRQRLRALLRKFPYLRDASYLQAQKCYTPLICTACWQNRGMLPWLLQHGFDPDARGYPGDNTPLMGAAAEGDLYLIRHLVRAGADVNATNERGETPLGYAVAYEQTEAVRLLAAHGANVNSTEGWEWTNLDSAIMGNRQAMIQTLRSLGAKRREELLGH